jgi:hypothetical protein
MRLINTYINPLTPLVELATGRSVESDFAKKKSRVASGAETAMVMIPFGKVEATAAKVLEKNLAEKTAIKIEEKIAAEGVADVGTKLEYVFGKAGGSAHNIERSTRMLKQLESIGIFDNAAGRDLLQKHLERAYKNAKGVLQSNGKVLRESLLMGPNGGLGVQSYWDGNKLISVILLGGK